MCVFGVYMCVVCVCLCGLCMCMCVQGKWLHLSYMGSLIYQYILIVLQFGLNSLNFFFKFLNQVTPIFPAALSSVIN